MAESTIPNAGWGAFSVNKLRSNEPVMFGDIVTQVPDIERSQAVGLSTLIHNYMWHASVTGGQHEGYTSVYTVWPGMGSLANSHLDHFFNLVPDRPIVDNAGQRRDVSPSAGAFTYYHSLQHYAYTEIPAGAELFINYGSGWSHKISGTTKVAEESSTRTV